jgi:uncharacterized protein
VKLGRVQDPDNVEDRRRRARLPVWAALAAGVIGTGAAWRCASGDPDQSERAAQLAIATFGDGQQYWDRRFAAAQIPYRAAVLVLYRAGTPSGCGYGIAAMGPFYCPADHRIYLDLAFQRQLEKLGATGEAALAYAIAHELGHHVQQVGRLAADGAAVARELQADCLAGAWLADLEERGLVEAGDVEAALRAVGAVGDDRLLIAPDGWRHGSGADRAAAVAAGRAGGPAACGAP